MPDGQRERGAGLHVYVVRRGSGPAVVFTHGLGDDHTCWDGVVAAASPDLASVRWDLRGHGESDRPSDAAAYSLELAARDLAAIVSRTEAPVTLVGHSLGGYLSLLTALRTPRAVAGLVLIATGPGYRDEQRRAQWNRFVDDVAPAMSVPTEARKLAHQHDSWVIDHVGELACPVIQIHGERDHRLWNGVAWLAEQLPRAETVVVPDCGHHPHRKNPALVADAIERCAAGDHRIAS